MTQAEHAGFQVKITIDSIRLILLLILLIKFIY